MVRFIILPVLLFFSFSGLAQKTNLDGFINEYVAKHGFQGVVLAQKGGKVVYHNAFGKANIPFGINTENNTKFRVASITKLFTAVLILKLYEQRKIDLNATIATYLPNYTGEAAQQVTIRHLLNQTSGMENMEDRPDPDFQYNWLEIYGKPYSSDQILTKFCQGKMKREPGKVFEYNNGEYVILGKIIEHVCQKSFEAVLNDYLLGPLQLANSGMCIQTKIIPRLADTYSLNRTTNVLEKDQPYYIQNWYSAGAMYSTTMDLLTFINSLFQHKLLKKETLSLLTTPGLGDYGYGVWIRGSAHKVLERYGRIHGTNTVILRYLDSDLTIIILGNTDVINNLGPFGYLIADQLTN